MLNHCGDPPLSTFKTICYPAEVIVKSKMTKYGRRKEKSALPGLDNIKLLHMNLTISSHGLIITISEPCFATSPDGMVVCDCCGKGCIELKCPYTMKDESTKWITIDKDFLKPNLEKLLSSILL